MAINNNDGDFLLESVEREKSDFLLASTESDKEYDFLLDISSRNNKTYTLEPSGNEERDSSKATVQNFNIHINNFQGVLGDSIGDISLKNTNNLIERGNKDSLFQYLRDNNIKNSDILLLDQAIESNMIPDNINELGSPIDKWLKKTISKGTWDISIATIGGLLTSAIAHFYGLI